MYVGAISGVAGRERMGTAFPHKKLSWERGPHKRNYERYLLIIAIKLAIFHCYHSCYSIPCMSILEIKPYELEFILQFYI